ncbi:hypothetical protein JCM18918_903 [Cutibacterium acnes JCM 18918]|nr:hypothetical protein JCM18918_903 [Cutibacterium acnes JCM 18918]
MVPEYRIPRNLHARGGHGGHNATEIAVYLGKTGTLVYVTAMRFGIVEQRIPESLHTFPAIAGTGIGNDRATGQQREIPVEFHVFVIIGVVTSADESVKGPASSRTALKRIDSAHQRGRSEWPQRLLRAEGRASQRMQELDLIGDCTSVTCRSVTWTKDAKPSRRSSRPLLPLASSSRTTSG